MDVLKDEPHTHELLLNERIMQEVTAAQLIDKLRMRGTPIDMIDSYLLAGEHDAAGIAFRSVILETVYEHLRLNKHLNVQFSTKQNPHVHVPEGMLITVAEFFPGYCVQTMQYDLTNQNVQPPVYQLGSDQDMRDVGDSLRATVLLHIAHTTTGLLERVRQALDTIGTTHVRLYPSWSVGTLKVIPAAGDYYLPVRSLGSHVALGISAYQLKKKEIDR